MVLAVLVAAEDWGKMVFFPDLPDHTFKPPLVSSDLFFLNKDFF